MDNTIQLSQFNVGSTRRAGLKHSRVWTPTIAERTHSVSCSLSSQFQQLKEFLHSVRNIILGFFLFYTKSSKAVIMAFVLAASTVSAQTTEMAPAPAASMDTGNALSLSVSGAVIGSSLIISLFALLKHWQIKLHVSAQILILFIY